MDRQDRYFSTKADYDKTVCFLKRNDYVTDKKKKERQKKDCKEELPVGLRGFSGALVGALVVCT